MTTFPPISPASLPNITPTRLYGPHDTFLTAVAYSPDGALLATADLQGTLMLWDIATGVQMARTRPFTTTVAALAFARESTPGTYTLSLIANHDTIHTLRLDGNGNLATVKKNQQEGYRLLDVTFSDDGRPVIACVNASDEMDSRLYIIYGDEKEIVAVFKSGNDSNPNASYSADGAWLAVGHDDGRVSIRGTRKNSGTRLKIDTRFNGVKRTAFSGDGRYLAAVEDRGDGVAVYDARNGKLIGEPIAAANANDVRLNQDGTLLAVSTNQKGGSLYFYFTSTSYAARTIKASSPMAFSPDGSSFTAGNSYAVYSKSAMMWDEAVSPDGLLSRVIAPVDAVGAETNLVSQLSVLRGHQGAVNALAFSPDNRTLASGGADDHIHLWNMETGGDGAVLFDHRAEVTDLSFSPDGHTLVSSSGYFSGNDDNNVRIWDTDENTQAAIFEEHLTRVVGVAYTPRSDTIVSAESAGTVIVWECESMLVSRRIQTPTVINDMALSPSGALVATAHGSETALKDTCIRLYNTDTGELLREINDPSDWVLQITFSPDGNMLLGADYSGRICGWDVTTGRLMQDFTGGHDARYNPQGDLVAIITDKSVKLTAVDGGDLLMTLRHGANVTSLAFSHEGDLLAVGSDDGAVTLWGVEDTSNEYADTGQIERKRLETARSGRHTLQLLTIECKTAQERDGDETFIRLDGQTIWHIERAGRKMHHQPTKPREVNIFNFKECRMLGPNGWQQTNNYTPADFRFSGLTGPLTLELWEEDNFLRGGDDFLGGITISPTQAGQGDQQTVIYQNGVHYIITYEVTHE